MTKKFDVITLPECVGCNRAHNGIRRELECCYQGFPGQGSIESYELFDRDCLFEVTFGFDETMGEGTNSDTLFPLRLRQNAPSSPPDPQSVGSRSRCDEVLRARTLRINS